jgi:hypothetical protein
MLVAFLAGSALIKPALLGPVLTAAPASAANGTSSVGCSTGDSCEVMLEKMVTFNYSPGASNLVVNITPPPCLWEPIGDGTTGSQAIVSDWGKDPAQAPTDFGIDASVKQAEGFLTNPPPPAGTWYELPVNPAAGQAGEQECLQLPLYAWVTPGNAPPGIDIPPATLAQLAVAKMALPTAGAMRLNPASGRTFTNLPTYLRVALAGTRSTRPPACPTPRSRLSSGPTGPRSGGCRPSSGSARPAAASTPRPPRPAVTWARPRSAPRRPGTPARAPRPTAGPRSPRPPPGRSPRP